MSRPLERAPPTYCQVCGRICRGNKSRTSRLCGICKRRRSMERAEEKAQHKPVYCQVCGRRLWATESRAKKVCGPCQKAHRPPRSAAMTYSSATNDDLPCHNIGPDGGIYCRAKACGDCAAIIRGQVPRPPIMGPCRGRKPKSQSR